MVDDRDLEHVGKGRWFLRQGEEVPARTNSGLERIGVRGFKRPGVVASAAEDAKHIEVVCRADAAQPRKEVERFTHRFQACQPTASGCSGAGDTPTVPQVELDALVSLLAELMHRADSRRPVATNARSGIPYQPGLGPHSESRALSLALEELTLSDPELASTLAREVPYPTERRRKCDLVVGTEWAVEVKMLRMIGDNGKPNDNMLMHILSPYPAHRSAVTDCAKLLDSGLPGRKAVVIFGYDHDDWPIEVAATAFEVLAAKTARLVATGPVAFGPLVHPVHHAGFVQGWEVLRPPVS